MTDQPGCYDCEWTAEARRNDRGREVTVKGTCTCKRQGFALSLEPTTPGIVPEPETLHLRLIVEEPEVGPEVLTPTSVEGTFPIGDEVRTVGIRRYGVAEVRDIE